MTGGRIVDVLTKDLALETIIDNFQVDCPRPFVESHQRRLDRVFHQLHATSMAFRSNKGEMAVSKQQRRRNVKASKITPNPIPLLVRFARFLESTVC